MVHRIASRHIPWLLAALTAVVAVVVAVIPPEAKLGSAIRVVLLHGALARTGIVVFGLAAMAGATAMILERPWHAPLNRTLQLTAVTVWVTHVLSSIVATWLTWGVAIAWGEPRTQAAFKILLMAVVFLAVTRYVGSSRLTAAANLIAGLASFVLVRSAGTVQHPVNPVMGADAAIFPVLFVILWAVLTVMALLAARWIHVRFESTVATAAPTVAGPDTEE